MEKTTEKSMETTEFDQFMADTIRDIIDPLAQVLADIYFPDPPPNLLVPEKVWRENTKREISDLLSGAEVRKKIQRGLELIFNYVRTQLSTVESEGIAREWEEGCVAYMEFLNKESSRSSRVNGDNADADAEEPVVEEVMRISPPTIEHFYASGLRLFQQRQYKDAASVFTVLTVLNYRRHNVWLSLGMALQNDNEIELALQAYTIAAKTNPDDPLSYIHSGECCIISRDFVAARDHLKTAQEAIGRSTEDRGDLTGYIENLTTECK